jgi:hypothetical protein
MILHFLLIQKNTRTSCAILFQKLAENNLTYFYLSHVVIVVTAVTTINLTPVVIGVEHQVSNFSAITSTRTSKFREDNRNSKRR